MFYEQSKVVACFFLLMVGYINDLLLDRQAMPLHTPCPGLNFVYFPIPVAQVAPPFDQPVNLVLVLSKKTDQPAPEVWQTT